MRARTVRSGCAPATAFPWIGAIEVRDSVLTIAEGAGRPPVVIEIPNATFRSSAPNQPMQIDGRFAAPKATPLDLTGTAGSFDGWMRGLPGNIDVQGGFGGGKIAIKGGVGVKGTTVQINSEGPDVSVFGPYIRLPVPAGGPYALSAKAATQRSAFKVDVTTLKVGSSELTADVLFRVDRKGTATITAQCRCEPSRPRRPARGAGRAGPGQCRVARPAAPRADRCRFRRAGSAARPSSVTARLGEIVGLGSKVQNASLTLTSSETRFAFRAAATVGSGSAGFDLAYDPTGRIGQATLTATANRVPLGDLSSLLGFDLGLRDAVADIDLRLRGGGRTTRDALNSASGSVDVAIAKGTWPRDPLADWPAETQKLLGSGEGGVPFNCIAGRFDVSGGVASLRRLVVDTPRATLVGGGYVHLRSEGWEFILAPEARDNQNAALASPLRLKGGSGRQTVGALEPALAKLIVPGGGAPAWWRRSTWLRARRAPMPAPPWRRASKPCGRACAHRCRCLPRPICASARPGPRRRTRRRSPANSAEPISLPKKAAAAVPEDCRRPRPSVQPAKLRPKTKPATGLASDRKREHGRAVSLAASGRHREATS